MVNVLTRIDFVNDSGDRGTLRGSLALGGVPSVGSKVQVRAGGLFYTVKSVLFGRSGIMNVNLGRHNLSPRTVLQLLDAGFRISR